MVVQQWLRGRSPSFRHGLVGMCLTGMAAGAVANPNDVYQEEGGLLVIELESASPGGSWFDEAGVAGHTGASYIRWNGSNHFNSPGNGVFGFDFEIHEAGTYDFRIRNHHDDPDPTEENDVWVRMDGGQWVKTFSSVNNEWTWATRHEFGEHDKPLASYSLAEGTHRIEFSGRSHDFRMDRFHLARPGHPDSTNPGAPESTTQLGTQENVPPVAKIRVTPDVVSANGQGTIVTLDASQSFDSNADQNLSFMWAVRGAKFVDGTTPRSRVARVRFRSRFAMPVRLIVTDDADEPLKDIAYDTINVEGAGARLEGDAAAWHPIELWFEGPTLSETDDAPNPFLDYRLVVDFEGPNGQEYRVQGFFDGDGEGNGTGNVWKARFSADTGGIWNYSASFRTGERVAINPGVNAGQPAAFDGASGRFFVFRQRNDAEGFLQKGRLTHTGEHYMQFADGSYFIKGGTDSPENLLGYRGFDDIQDNGGVGILHEYPSHRADWRDGDPLFTSNSTGVDSKGLIGALNYLGDEHVNSVYFLPMNLGGDGQDTCPFVGYSNTTFDKCHYDISRMHQWNQVFNHAQTRGILLHFVLAETESGNENWLDGGNLGIERKLFYRELSARFGHLMAIKWNLSEENDFHVSKLIDFAEFIDSVDPYDHPISVHTHPNNFDDYEEIVGNPLFSSTSIQYDPNQAGNHTEQWRANSAASGHKWIVDMDENNPYHTGLTNTNGDDLRKRVLYDVYFSGGQVEWYMGYHSLPLGGDLRCEDFRTREAMWKYMWYARKLMQDHLPFWEMEPADELLTGEAGDYGGGQVFAKTGTDYAIYLPKASQGGRLDLTAASGQMRARWFNPRSGQFVGQPALWTGGTVREIGTPIHQQNDDWVLLVQSTQRD